jgi:hypothetical protein
MAAMRRARRNAFGAAAHFALALPLLAALFAAGCKQTPAARVEQTRYRDSMTVRELDAARARLARLEEERGSDRDAQARLQDQLKGREEIEGVLKERVANLQRETERLQTDLSGTILAGASATPVANQAKPAPPEQFRLPAPLVGKLARLSESHPAMKFDKRLKAVRIDGDWMFQKGDELSEPARRGMADLASALLDAESRNLKLVVAVAVDPRAEIPRERQAQHPTDWHLAAHQAVAVQQYLEERKVPAANVGVTVQQYPESAAKRSRVEIYFNPADVDEG